MRKAKGYLQNVLQMLGDANEYLEMAKLMCHDGTKRGREDAEKIFRVMEQLRTIREQFKYEHEQQKTEFNSWDWED